MGSDWSWSQLKNDNGIPKQYSTFQQGVERICKIRKGEIMPIEVDYILGLVNALNKRGMLHRFKGCEWKSILSNLEGRRIC